MMQSLRGQFFSCNVINANNFKNTTDYFAEDAALNLSRMKNDKINFLLKLDF